MPRNMSFRLTTEAARNRTKTVTRRRGWAFLRPGDVVQQVEQAMGLAKGEKVVKIHRIRIRSNQREPLSHIARYGPEETAREGFPEMTPTEFMHFFCAKNGGHITDWVQRIEFVYED